MKDWRGVNVYAGDTVVYSTRQGSSMYVVEGVVELAEENGARVKVVRSTAPWREYKKPVWVGGSYLTVVALAASDDSA